MMERLTKRQSDGSVIAWHTLEYYNYNDFKKVLDRLAYYEDMEEQGRLFIKPFKEGETAYYADKDAGCVLMGYVASYEILSDGAVYVEFTNVESGIEWVSVQLTLAEAEKTVFLTREEAEQALKGGADIGDRPN